MVWITLVFQFLFPISIAFSPAIAAAIKPQTIIATQPYVLGPGESPFSVAHKYHLSVDELKKFNQFRTFSKPFEQSGVGDEIDVPLNVADFSAHDPVSKPQDPSLGNFGGMSVFNAQPSAGNGIFTTDGNSVGAPAPADQNREAANAMLRSAATGEIGQKAQQWLNQFGTARVQLNVNDDFHLDGSAFDLLVPLYDKPNEMLFSQWGYRNKDSRNTINIGAGARTWLGSWMYGMNAFYDEDITAHNRRFGMGLEAWRDYLKLSANNYFRLSDWRESRDLEDYNERPANGFDIRAEAYLPSYPQLGGKLIFEQYRGDNVALFGKDNLQNNPYAVTLGVNYTPISLVTLGVDYRQGKGDMNDTTFNLQMNYRLGASWQSQISADGVASLRTLAGNRYDLVDRNYDIVLQYQKQQVIELRLPDHVTGYEGDPLTVTAQVTSKYALDHIDWNDAEIIAAGGKVTQAGQNTLTVTLPPYQHAGAATNLYNLSAVAYDVRKNASNTASTRIEVLPVAAQITAANLNATKNDAIANGSDYNEVRAKVTDAAGNPVAGQTVTFTATNGATVTTVTGTTGADGFAIATLTNLRAGTSVVTATLNGVSRSVNTNFNADPSTAKVTLSVVRTGVVANGTATNEVSALVEDANGNKLAGQRVTFTATLGTVTEVINPTGADGIATATLTSLKDGSSTVTATLTNGNSQGKDVTFIADAATARLELTVENSGATADGINRNEVRAHVTDANGNNLAGQTVNFTVAAPALLFSTTNPTDAGGIVTATFISKSPGTMAVTATLSNGNSRAENIVFVPDTVTAKVVLTVIHTGAAANGTATNEVSAHVTDALGNDLVGQSVTFTANDVDISPVVLVTGAGGTVSATFTSHKAGSSTVVATLTNGNNASKDIEFIADTATARVVLTVVHTGAVADGIDTNEVSALVEDANGNKLAGQTVNFTVTAPALLLTTTNPTDAGGIVTATFNSTSSGTMAVTATLSNGNNASKNIDFIADIATARVVLTVIHTGAVANGAATNEVSAHVTDALGNDLEGQSVTFTANDVDISPVMLTTGVGGTVSATFTSHKAGSSTVVATLTNGNNASKNIEFIADTATARVVLTVVHTGAVADGIDTNEVSALVEDANGNKLAEQNVAFTATNGAIATAVINPTGPDGIATATLVSETEGDSVVTAQLAGGVSATQTVNFARNIFIVSITVTENNGMSNGSDPNYANILVHDAAGNPLQNALITVSGSAATGTFRFVVPTAGGTTTSGATGADGILRVQYTNSYVSSTTLTARATNGTELTATGGNFRLPNLTMLPLVDTAPADNITPASVIIKLTSFRDGSPVVGTHLNFTAGRYVAGTPEFTPATMRESSGITDDEGQATAYVISPAPTNLVYVIVQMADFNDGGQGVANRPIYPGSDLTFE
ncbi:Ig-like domain-containing protein [Sodalis ligni]|uniref:Ig-like domain-containing protein n=1 Tax=Sodalis ligni TaxID=2697027 RepID=UPI00193EF2C6|nr:Ig-like domain-containing protein [Sodalis ligni]QWA11941.1 Ig-like domain-containing protein [Sodalis ligni]